MADIFISFNASETLDIDSLGREFELLGWTCWWDGKQSDSSPSDTVTTRAERLAACRCVVVVFATEFCNSAQVLDDAREAHRRDILVPISAYGGIPPREFQDVEVTTLSIDWMGVVQPDSTFRDLTNMIKRKLGLRKIFVSYRREDSEDVTGRICDELVKRYGKSAVFVDVTSMPHGANFRKHISEQVGACEVMLVIIGRDWLSAKDLDGTLRLEKPDDLVRVEIESAFARGIPVIPLLVRRAQPLSSDHLPVSLADLASRHGLRVRPEPDFRDDIARLIAGIDQYVN